MDNYEASVIAMLAAYRKGSNFGPDFSDQFTQKFWLSRLAGIAPDRIKAALNQLSGNREFPTVNMVLENISGTNPGDARKAFEWVWNHLDGYKQPQNLPYLTAKTIDELGGWFVISRNWKDSTQQGHERQFIAAYELLAQRRARGEALGGSRLALNAPESQREGIGSDHLPEWKKRHLERLEREVKILQEKSRSSLSFSEQVRQLAVHGI